MKALTLKATTPLAVALALMWVGPLPGAAGVFGAALAVIWQNLKREDVLLGLCYASGLMLIANAASLAVGGGWVMAGESFAVLNLLLWPSLFTGLYKRRGWWLWAAGFAVVALASDYRSGWLGLAAGAVVYLWLTHRLNIKALVLIIGVGAAVATWQALGRPQGGRAELWGVAWQLIAAAPTLGNGLGSFAKAYAAQYPAHPPFAHAHNWLLQTWAEGGAVAVFIQSSLLAVGMRNLWRNVNRPMAKALLCSSASLATMSLFDTPTYINYIGALVLALYGLYVQELLKGKVI